VKIDHLSVFEDSIEGCFWVFAEIFSNSKVNSLLCKVLFFPPKFSFPKYKRKIWREKITLPMNEVRIFFVDFFLKISVLEMSLHGPTLAAVVGHRTP
jgi:hypothetical protein